MDIAVTIAIIAAVVIIAIAAVWVVSSGKSRDLIRRQQLEIEEKNSELASLRTSVEELRGELGQRDLALAKAEEAATQNEGQAKTEAEEKPLTAEDVRAAMHKTRKRIEGEDYLENTKGDLYKKYHKPLTATFKNIAALLGAEKPSALPSDKIASFMEQCDELRIMEDGTIGPVLPF